MKAFIFAIFSTLTLFFFIPSIQAQETILNIEIEEDIVEEKESKLMIGGSVDAYFRANLIGDEGTAPGTSFANLPGFSLGMANLTLSKEGNKAGFMADFVVGPRGEDATFNSPFLRPGGSSSIVNQLYVYVNLTDKVTATFGNFNTFLGYEMISPASNFNYSTSYLFSNGPFSHTGMKFDFDLGGGSHVMAGVFNPTDFTEFNPINEYVGGVQVGYEFDKGSIYLNSLISDDFVQVDLTAGADVTDNVFVGLNVSSASDAFSGAAAYLQVTTGDQLTLGTRVEYFLIQDKASALFDENILDVSFTANYTIGDLTIIPELRIDVGSKEIFADDGQLEKSLASFVLAAVYGF